MRARLLETSTARTVTHTCSLWPSQQRCRNSSRRQSPRIAARALPVDDQDLKQLLGQSFLRPEFEDLSDEHVSGPGHVVTYSYC